MSTEIIEVRSERERLAARVDVLDKVKALATLPGHEEATTAMVADYYGVDPETVKRHVVRHREELVDNGYRVLTGQALGDFKSLTPEAPIGSRLALWPRRAILNLGMLLRDSEVAKEVRRYLLDAEQMVSNVEQTGEPLTRKQLAAYWLEAETKAEEEAARAAAAEAAAERYEAQIAKDAPKVEFAEEIAARWKFGVQGPQDHPCKARFTTNQGAPS